MVYTSQEAIDNGTPEWMDVAFFADIGLTKQGDWPIGTLGIKSMDMIHLNPDWDRSLDEEVVAKKGGDMVLIIIHDSQALTELPSGKVLSLPPAKDNNTACCGDEAMTTLRMNHTIFVLKMSVTLIIDDVICTQIGIWCDRGWRGTLVAIGKDHVDVRATYMGRCIL